MLLCDQGGVAGSTGLPRIIGGSDLEVHSASRSRELDDWFREAAEVGTGLVYTDV